MKAAEEGENREGGRIGDEGMREDHVDDDEHKGIKRTKGNPNLSKTSVFFVYN